MMEIERRLDRRIITNPAFAIETAHREAFAMTELAVQSTKMALESLVNANGKMAKKVIGNEQVVNQYEKMITTFLVDVDNAPLVESQHEMVKNLFYIISDAERIGDHAEHIARLSLNKINEKTEFSNKGNKDLDKIMKETITLLDLMLESFNEKSTEAIKRADKLENKIDEMEEELRGKHIQRLSKGKCSPANGVIFLGAISNLERISNHANNIVNYVEP
ncbi:MAG: PhoU domain-containing protein, partial [Eubacteriales bacterium]